MKIQKISILALCLSLPFTSGCEKPAGTDGAELEELSAQIQAMQTQLQELEAEKAALTAENTEKTTQLNSCLNQNIGLTNDLGSCTGQKNSLQLELNSCVVSLREERLRFSACAAQLTDRDGEIIGLHQQLANLKDEVEELQDQRDELIFTDAELSEAVVADSRVFDLGFDYLAQIGFSSTTPAEAVIRQSYTSDKRVRQVRRDLWTLTGLISTTVSTGSWVISGGVLVITPDPGSTGFLNTQLRVLRMPSSLLYLVPASVTPVTSANWDLVPINRREYRQRERYSGETF
jgi:prefoldin subunit 5